MFWFICFIVLMLIGIGFFILAPMQKVEVKPRRANADRTRMLDAEYADVSLKKLGWIPVGLSLIALLFSLFAVVGTRNVGVERFMTATTGRNLDAGLHLKAPWNNVQDVDATIQVEEYHGDDCIIVKIADGGAACISLAYRWRINPDGADKVFADYNKSDVDIVAAVKKALVSTNIKAGLNEVLGLYDPLSGADITAKMTPAELANLKINVVPDYEDINADVKRNVDKKIEKLGDLIDIQSITVSYVKLPDATQKKINRFNQAAQDTKVELQQVATKAAQAEGNEKLAKSLQDPNVLVSKCFDALTNGDIKPVPGFSCWQGGGTGVVLPATK